MVFGGWLNFDQVYHEQLILDHGHMGLGYYSTYMDYLTNTP